MKSEKIIERFTVAVIITILLSSCFAAGITVVYKTEYNMTGEKPPVASEILSKYENLKNIIKFE